MWLTDKRVVVTGGTGSLGTALIRRLLRGDAGNPREIVVFSRDEAKQHQMRLSYLNQKSATDEVIYSNFEQLLSFRIGDVRDYASVRTVLRDAHVVFNAAALKQVPACEYFPFEAVRTNIGGAQNIVRAVADGGTSVELVVGVSTDKACKPINVMGMTKALQERIFVEGNLKLPDTRLVCVRYGNVIASRGSVVPLFLDQIAHGGPVTITDRSMTRFLLSLDDAVDIILAAGEKAGRGETWIPKVPAARVVDLAAALINGRSIETVETGIRPGEKVHEILVSEEERFRTVERPDHYVIRPMLPELLGETAVESTLAGEYSSEDVTLDPDDLKHLLAQFVEAIEQEAAAV